LASKGGLDLNLFPLYLAWDFRLSLNSLGAAANKVLPIEVSTWLVCLLLWVIETIFPLVSINLLYRLLYPRHINHGLLLWIRWRCHTVISLLGWGCVIYLELVVCRLELFMSYGTPIKRSRLMGFLWLCRHFLNYLNVVIWDPVHILLQYPLV
jgi:hypothetical protein